MNVRELEQELDLRARLEAIIYEAGRGDPDETVAVIAEGALDELDRLEREETT